MNIDIQQLIISIISGLIGSIIGALVGGYLSYKGAIDASRKQIEYLYQQEREQRDLEKEKQKNEILNSLRTETRLNHSLSINLITHQGQANLRDIGVDPYFSPLLIIEAWSVHRGNINLLSRDLQEILIDLYTNIISYNALLSNYKIAGDITSFTVYQLENNPIGTMREYLSHTLEQLSEYSDVATTLVK